MIIKTAKDNYEKITYDVNDKNYNIMNPFNSIEFFNIHIQNDNLESIPNFVEKLINLIRAENTDWGSKEVYLSFDEIEYLIGSAKVLHDRYAEGIV